MHDQSDRTTVELSFPCVQANLAITNLAILKPGSSAEISNYYRHRKYPHYSEILLYGRKRVKFLAFTIGFLAAQPVACFPCCIPDGNRCLGAQVVITPRNHLFHGLTPIWY